MTRHEASTLPFYVHAIVACIVTLATVAFLGGCASLLKGKSGSEPGISAKDKKDGLIKPRIADTTSSGKDTLPNPKVGNTVDEFDTTKAGTEPSSTGPPLSTRQIRAGRSRTPSPLEGDTKETDKPRGREIVSSGPRPTIEEPAGPLSEPGNEQSERVRKPDPKATTASGPKFKKHNHLDYVKKLRRKAIELVNKNRSSFYARICKDHISEEWALTIYEKSRGKFWFTKHVWDHIENRWEKSFKSQKQPLAKLKRHVKFASAGKECETMKGLIR